MMTYPEVGAVRKQRLERTTTVILLNLRTTTIYSVTQNWMPVTTKYKMLIPRVITT